MRYGADYLLYLYINLTNIKTMPRFAFETKANKKVKEIVLKDGIVEYVQSLLEQIQENLFNKALSYRDSHITEVNSFEEFKEVLDNKAGFVSAHWDGTPETEEQIKNETKATIRCIPIDNKLEAGMCIKSGKPSTQRVLFAKAY